MNSKYRPAFKKMACELLPKFDNRPTLVAREINVSIKTYEKWICKYRKDNKCFDEKIISIEEQNKELIKKLKEKEELIEVLKKAYAFSTERKKF